MKTYSGLQVCELLYSAQVLQVFMCSCVINNRLWRRGECSSTGGAAAARYLGQSSGGKVQLHTANESSRVTNKIFNLWESWVRSTDWRIMNSVKFINHILKCYPFVRGDIPVLLYLMYFKGSSALSGAHLGFDL